jgi:molybdopterin synthase catalytic subunit
MQLQVFTRREHTPFAMSASSAPNVSSGESGGSRDVVVVTHDPLDLSALVAAVSGPQCGAISTFLGVTRDTHMGKKVVRLEYEGYAPMAVKELTKICGQIRQEARIYGRCAAMCSC